MARLGCIYLVTLIFGIASQLGQKGSQSDLLSSLSDFSEHFLGGDDP